MVGRLMLPVAWPLPERLFQIKCTWLWISNVLFILDTKPKLEKRQKELLQLVKTSSKKASESDSSEKSSNSGSEEEQDVSTHNKKKQQRGIFKKIEETQKVLVIDFNLGLLCLTCFTRH